MDKINPITITNEQGELVYTLEFNRETVAQAERSGFDINKVDSMPMTLIPLLFYWSFKMHHPNIKREKTDQILFDEIGGLNDKVSKRLQELYYAPFETLLQDEEEGTERKNPKFKFQL